MSPDGEIRRFKDNEMIPKDHIRLSEVEAQILLQTEKAKRIEAYREFGKRDGKHTKPKFDKSKIRKQNKIKRKQGRK